VGRIGEQVVGVELALEPGERALDGREDRLDRGQVGGVPPMLLGVENPLQRPIGDQDRVGVMVAGREHLGQPVGRWLSAA
jgi:hypothetical protein